MNTHPLLSDQTLSFSPQLAATLGLLECLTLTVLNEAARYSSANTNIERSILMQRLAFLSEKQIAENLIKLQSQGVIYLSTNAQLTHTLPPRIEFSFKAETRATFNSQAIQRIAEPQTSKTPDWHPSPDTLFRLTLHGISEAFSLSQLDAALLKMADSPSFKQNPESQFFNFVKKQYVFNQQQAQKQNQKQVFNTQSASNKQPMHSHWQPSQSAIEILHVNNEVPIQFIEDALPEFILYWQERGEASSTWSSKFLNHVRSQWNLVKSNQANAREPKPINKDWRPSAACFEVLELAYINQEFAESVIQEFVLYWMNDGKAFPSWDNKFLQYVKQRWQYLKQSPQGNNNNGSNSTQPGYATAEASLERLKDTSWAY